MLSVFRRHEKHCPHRSKGRNFRKCFCTVWVDGRIGGFEVHKSLRTRDWEKAQRVVRGWEANGNQYPAPPPEPITLELALQGFMADLHARRLHASTIRKYQLLVREMRAFANDRGLLFLRQFDVSTLSEFRISWRLNRFPAAKN
jgi:hypothetical protein